MPGDHFAAVLQGSYRRPHYAAAAGHGSSTFEVPLSRAEMADYLCVDRSALSAVLSRLQQEGLIRFKRNRFTIL